jgi:methionyl aminopeptidase
MIVLKSPGEIETMRKAGKIVARVLDEMGRAAKPGVRTKELDKIADEIIRSAGATPSFFGYHGYPASICTSINEQVVHGIPDQTKLQDGDIISIDVGAYYGGFHGDATVTFAVGQVDKESLRLMDVTRESLHRGIDKVRSGGRLTDISHAVQEFVEANGFSVVRDYVGHGIGQKMHEDPEIPNFGPPGLGPVLRPGMTFAIEPMINVGGYAVMSLSNGWTVVTKDGLRSAHFEHTVAVTDDGPEILTVL